MILAQAVEDFSLYIIYFGIFNLKAHGLFLRLQFFIMQIPNKTTETISFSVIFTQSACAAILKASTISLLACLFILQPHVPQQLP